MDVVDARACGDDGIGDVVLLVMRLVGVVENRVTPGSAATSYLYQVVSGTQTVGSPMPLTGLLPLAEQTTIHDWIQQGALDN